MKKKIIIGIMIFCLLTIVVTFYFVNKISIEFQNSEPFKVIILELNSIDSLKLNDGYEISPVIGGTLTPDYASFHIKVKTSSGKISIYADLSKNSEDYWEIKDLQVLER